MNLLPYPVLTKSLFFILLYFAHGRPFVGIIDYGFVFIASYLLLFGRIRQTLKPAFVICGLVLLLSSNIIPQLQIPEQERFLIDSNSKQILPGEFLKDISKYPYAITADGFLQGYKQKRMVSTIDIDQGVLSLRSGWINRPEYNFFPQVSPYIRQDLPFVVRYEIIPQLVGMTLSVEGLIVLERGDRFKIHDPAVKTLTIEEHNVGSSLYGFGGQWDDKGYNSLKIKLEKSINYKVYDALKTFSLFLGMLLLFLGLFNFPRTIDFALQSFLLGLSALTFWISFPRVFRWGILARGGMDGVIHDGYPYIMLEQLISRNWREALISPESVFYFMPGMRYVRFTEMLVFGDAYILQISLLLFIPIIFYRFCSVFLTRTTSLAFSLISFMYLLNGIGLSYKLYIQSMLDLYGEGFAFGLFFITLTLLSKSLEDIRWGFFAFFLGAITLSIRPNMAIFFAVIVGVHLFTHTFSSLPWKSRLVMLFGLCPVLLIPIHNILGGEFVLVSKASQIVENLPLTPYLYYQGLLYLLGFIDSFQEAGRFMNHLQEILPHQILLWLLLLWVTIKDPNARNRVISLATLAGLSVHFFFLLPTLRYIHPYLTIAIVLGLSQISRLRVSEGKINAKSFG